MAEVIWTEPALQELDAIAEYIALDNPVAAGHLVQNVLDKTGRLEEFPQSGRIPPELPDSVYREVVVLPCRIFYREDEQQVLVLYVMREERQLRAYMLGKQLTRRVTRMPLSPLRYAKITGGFGVNNPSYPRTVDTFYS
ncbi:type II toxin-antitoxin system RelE/ParE family toxin [Marinobacterium sp. BA1]|uniref:type II toxin-antitoxin system RelE/ParE family toxin n=1 Tax=Marinobacterium sp. BA1 TaxID=3138931 RepID=UPI0032E7D4F2